MIKVFGHTSPDTDATGSAILWAWYLNSHTTEPAEAFVLGSLNKETQFVLSRWEIPEPALLTEDLTSDDRVVIVDTNNPQELPATILEADITHIIDHHRLAGGLSISKPIEISIRPLACTATVIYDLVGQKTCTMPENIMGLVLSCILSDTLAFRSPTTTPHDKDVAESIAEKLGINIQSYANEMFTAKSDVSEFTDKGLINMDSKKTAIRDKSIRISVIETMNPQLVLDRKDSLVESIKECVAEESDIDDVLLFVIDILKEEAHVIVYNDFTKKLIADSFAVHTESDVEVLPGIISRKKQIIPALNLKD